jgi:hypothetical protein
VRHVAPATSWLRLPACLFATGTFPFLHAVARSLVPVIVLVADGARPDALAGDLAAYPALRRLRDEGGRHELTSVFPSVTGPAYLPFLLGRFPGAVGLPGLRWYDRTRTACGWPDYARSYVGWQMGRVNSDLDGTAPTIFELVPHSVAAMSMITRGLAPARQIGGLTLRSAARATVTHFRGRPERWLDVDREVANEVVRRMREERPDYLFAALTGVDKASHARGHEHEMVADALAIVDDVAGRLRDDAERGGWWEDTHLWIVSDHGHSPVYTHVDLVGLVGDAGHRAVAHPWSAGRAADVAVMVSGNAMAHLYVELESRDRPWWPRLAVQWEALVELLLAQPAVDLLLLPHSESRCEIRSATRGSAIVERCGERYRYRRLDGDPLGFRADLSGRERVSGCPGPDPGPRRLGPRGRHDPLGHPRLRLPRPVRADPAPERPWRAAPRSHAGPPAHQPAAGAAAATHDRPVREHAGGVGGGDAAGDGRSLLPLASHPGRLHVGA